MRIYSSFAQFTCVAVAYLFQIADCSNVVFFFGVSSYSHRFPAWPLVEALADNGHNVTFISPFTAKTPPNPKIFDYVPNAIKKVIEHLNAVMDVFGQCKEGSPLDGWLVMPSLGIAMCEEIYKDEEFVNWIKSMKVDLVVVGAVANDCVYGIAHYWGAKVILFDATAPFGYFSDTYGLPDETSSIPVMELANPIDMSFAQRLTNALVPLVLHYNRMWNFYPRLEEITREKLGMPNLPKFEELERDASLVFTNTYFAEEFARSLPPNVIPIGGIAYQGKRSTIPKEMETFLEKSDDFVYMSFGTLAKFNKFGPSIQHAFIGAMQNLSHINFLWKVEDESLVKLFPKNNVYISNWMPQQDILAHSKIGAFITHAGLIGIQEAIYNSVPLISFPIFAEQGYNAERIHQREYGIRLEINTVTQAQIEEAIQKILTDEKYRKNMKKVSAMFTERPQTPLETALWWTEFVIRHSKEELSALRPLNVGQSWWKRRQLDVWTTILLCVISFLCLCFYVIFLLIACACRVTTPSLKPLKKTARQKKFQ